MEDYIIKPAELQTGLRLDVFLSQQITSISRSKIQNLIKKGFVSINKNNSNIVITECNYKVDENEEYIVKNEKKETTLDIIPFDYSLDIIFEDDYILVINKPSGLVVHPGAGNTNNTLVNALVAKYGNKLSKLGGIERQGIVHRIDKDTSGVLLIAKTDYAHSILSKQFADHSIIRNYRALVWGVINPLNGTIDNIIGRNQSNRQKMSVLNNKAFIHQGYSLKQTSDLLENNIRDNVFGRGKRAITNYKTLKISKDKIFSLVDCSLQTGRTHQIRVHFSNIGNPIVGDIVYGKKNKNLSEQLNSKLSILKGQALHAYRLGFIHPIHKTEVIFEVSEPQNILELYDYLFNN